MGKKYEERVRERKVSTEWRGKTYEGVRVINGTNRLFQTIYYGGYSRFDSHRYSPGSECVMECIAKVILCEMLEEIDRNRT